MDFSRVANLAASLDSLRRRLSTEESTSRDGLGVNSLAVEGLALAAEASRRKLRMDPYEGQLLAALALRRGRVVQMQTGEGKTLVAALAAAIGALGHDSGQGLHILTANDYLARRDAEWMGPLYDALGLRVGVIGQTDGDEARRLAYAADVTYLTARECGFDYLRDQLRAKASDIVQRGRNNSIAGNSIAGEAIVDEADFILVDEARIPLVIAGESGLASLEALPADRFAARLVPGRDYDVDREGRRAPLRATGRRIVEDAVLAGALLPIGPEETERGVARVHAALVARRLLVRDVDYIVREGRVELVDGFTGRIADRRRWPWGATDPAT